MPAKVEVLLALEVLLVELELELLDNPHDATRTEMIQVMAPQFLAWYQECFKFILLFSFLHLFSLFF